MDSLRASPICTRNALGPPSPAHPGGGMWQRLPGGEGREPEAGGVEASASQHSPGLAPGRRLPHPSPVPDALRPPPRAAGTCVKGRLFSCCCMTPRPPERPSAGPLPVEAWAGTPAALSGTVGAAQRPWPVAPSTPPAAAAQLCPVSWGTVLNSSEMRGFWSCPQVVSSRGQGLSVLNTAGPGPTLGPMMVSHAWPPAHSHWREVMAGGEALLGIQGLRAPLREGWGGEESLGPGRGAAARQAWARPTRQMGVWVPALSALAVELGKPSLLGKFRQLPTHAAGGVLAGARGAARHRPAARGPGPPSPLVYPRPASGCHWGMEGKQGTPSLLLLSVRARSPTGDLLSAPHSSTKGPLGGAPPHLSTLDPSTRRDAGERLPLPQPRGPAP